MTRSRKEAESHAAALLTIPRTQFEAELDQRITIGQEFAERVIQSTDELEAARGDYYTWGDYNKEFLRKRFTSPEVADQYAQVLPRIIGGWDSLEERIADFREDVRDKLRRLDSIKKRIPLFEESSQTPSTRSTEPSLQAGRSPITSIFIVHGHADSLKLAVYAFLREVTEIQPVILHDQANEGRTVLEKFEAIGSAAGFAVVLLTGDDVGGPGGESLDIPELKPRARQNVVWEFGFFVGALRRNNVAVLYEEGVELPSDLHGLAYIPVDAGGGWKLLLARELKAAGIEVDPAKLI